MPDAVPEMIGKMPAAEELASAFDCGSWAAVLSLIKVLREEGVLDEPAFGKLLNGMRAISTEHSVRGETQRAEAVNIALHDVAASAVPG